MHVIASELPHREMYNLLLSSVAPRPIAWVSTLSASGLPNLAPFSFFNCVSVDPPLLAFAPGLRPVRSAASEQHGAQHEAKDTLRNVRETKEFVVSVVTYQLLERMNLTSGEYDPTVNEFDLAKLTPQPSRLVRPARVGESPVSFECRLHRILDFSTAPNGSSLVIGEIVAVYLDDGHLKDGRIDRNSLDLIGRMGGIQYTRTTQRVELARPEVAQKKVGG
ncbi:MAG TPA: flavin reductase family protein [Candidatus Acidoferrum sp.]|jgi:flavin reductase (DIM6/NTAB) family NADH-FMN oxidoreductase RutF|nr:flavin reductase family protein [Candidatus Acidoferrum sp.]